MVDFNVDLFSGILLVEPLLGALAHDDSDATLGCAMIVLGFARCRSKGNVDPPTPRHAAIAAT